MATDVDPLNGRADGSRLPAPPRNYLRPCLLLLLGEEPTYGYELLDKLAPLSAGHWDPGTVYRSLNTMEDEGLVCSVWERSAEGPRRRRYEITGSGSMMLDACARELCAVRDMIIEFIGRYEGDHGDRAPLPTIPGGVHLTLTGPDGVRLEQATGEERVAANGHAS